MKTLTPIAALLMGLAFATMATMTTVDTAAQPIVATNIVKLTPTTRLAWDANLEPNIDGYLVTMQQGQSAWTHYTRTNSVPILTLHTNAGTGTYLFSVKAVDKNGLESVPATLSTNLAKPPAMVIRLRLETSIEIQ